MRKVFAVIFPFSSPGWNAGTQLSRLAQASDTDVTGLVLGTFYISS